jgi:hypothetical protein
MEHLILAMSTLFTLAAPSIMHTEVVFGIKEKEKTDWFCIVCETAGKIAMQKRKYILGGDIEKSKLSNFISSP